MRPLLIPCLALALGVSVWFPSLTPAAEPPVVLLLNSYHPGYAWSDGEMQGIIDGLHTQYPSLEPFIEFLDTKRNPDEEHFVHLTEAFEHKYSTHHPLSLIFALDNPALKLAFKIRKTHLSDAPIVFLGINGFTPSMLEGKERVTGIAETLDVSRTVETISRFHPETAEIVLLSDPTQATQDSLRQVREDLGHLGSRFRFRFLSSGISLDSLISEVKSLSSAAAVISLINYSDEETHHGQLLTADRLIEVLSQASKAPFYVLHEQYIGKGSVGGSVLNATSHGQQAAISALKILAGEPAERVPVVLRNEGRLIFDFRQLQRFHIPSDRVPETAKIIFMPESFFAKNKKPILIAGAAGFSLTVVITLLSLYIFQRRRGEQRLRLQYMISSILSSASPHDEVEHPIIQTICEAVGWDFGAYWAVDPKTALLQCETVFSKTLFDAYAFEKATREQKFKIGEGLPGHVWATRSPVWISNLSKEMAGILRKFPFPRYPVAEKIGLRSAFAFPLISGEEFFGVVEFFGSRPAPLNKSLIQTFSSSANQIAQFLRRRRAERELIDARETAIAATRAKSDFLANMSHEIRTPLNSIIGTADMLAETPLTADQAQFVKTMTRASDTLLMLVNEILDLAKVESGVIRLQSIPFDLQELLNRIIDIFSARARQKDLEMRLHFNPLVPPLRVGDPDRLRQVLINLVGNAVKFTRQGNITLRVDAVSGMPNQEMVLFAVSDTGIGIPKEKIDSLFQRFEQADPTVAREFGGSGLGLNIAKQLIDLMGGQICVDSAVDHGSTFYFQIPLKLRNETSIVLERPDDCQIPEEAAEVSIRPLKILIAEDSEDNRELLRVYFRKSPHHLEFAENGEAAIHLFKRAPFDLLLMDIQMPVIDGLTAIRLIREWEYSQSRPPCPIIALTAYALKDELNKCLNAGANLTLTKPIRRTLLFSTINELLSSSPPVAPPRANENTETEPLEVDIDPLIADLIPGFLQNRRKDLDRLRLARTQNDFKVVEVVGHQIKGTSGGYGFAGLGRIGAQLEASAKLADPESVDRLLAEMDSYLRRVEQLRLS